jgi:hypothetical protein
MFGSKQATGSQHASHNRLTLYMPEEDNLVLGCAKQLPKKSQLQTVVLCYDLYVFVFDLVTLSIFYCSKRQKDKTQIKQLKQSSPITYISKYVSDKGYSRNMSCALNYICTFVKYSQVQW